MTRGAPLPARDSTRTSPAPSRRDALRWAGLAGLGVAGAGTLGACANRAEPPPARDLITPTTVDPPLVDGMITSDVERVAPIYLGSPHPDDYVSAVPQPPADGGTASSFQILWGPPVPGRDRNVVWQELEDRLGVDRLDARMAPDASFGDRLATLLASGELPDFVYIQDSDPNAVRAITDGAFLPLNEYLAGDQVLEYPNLATTEEQAWIDSAYDGNLIGVPMPAPARNNLVVLRLDAMKEVGTDEVPDNGEDLKDLWLELAKLGEVGGRRVWGHGALEPTTFEPLHDLGQEFQLVDGRVTHKYLLPQYEDHLAYMRELWAGGFFHPDSLGQVDPELFQQGQQLNYEASFAGFYWIPDQGRINVCRRVVPDAEFIHFAMPSVNGGVGRHQIDKGYGGRVCIPADRGDDPARVRELLRICDFYRSPFGSREALFLEQGVEGRQFEFDEDGNITQLSGATDEGSVTWLGLQKNQVNQLPLINEDLLENIMTTYEQSTESGELSAVDTLISGEYARQNAKLTEIHRDFFNAVVSGRRPVSDVDTFQQEWLDAGGQLVLEDFEAMLDEAS
ncbi:MAG TPA: hypothetical protein H9786_03400 [Candidatus Brachybacterium merdavium]|uniref:Extracellular solute-binding protein n=1 Tax=Candidatus Brachybacterium merdavium TaxID=2838513 RepID=A0A9D2LBL2_9MICO|nr:hypothetical protein [Candidatus Brachybacterium merdavium]